MSGIFSIKTKSVISDKSFKVESSSPKSEKARKTSKKPENLLNYWLETNWVSPAYGGGILFGISLCFFAAATNTMAGWLYVLSGMIFALLLFGAIMPLRSLQKLKVYRRPIEAVSVTEALNLELILENPTNNPITLVQLIDFLPYVLTQPQQTPIEIIPPQSKYHWNYYPQAKRRGVYHWQEVQLRTGTPLGLFWCRRSREVPARVVVYPQVLPLTHCPLIDNLGQDDSQIWQSDRLYQTAKEGLTRALRPYRLGDPTRLIHWRTSARFGELKVRELEIITGGLDVIICLDNASIWEEDLFEQAVIAAASLYFYAERAQLNVKLWTPSLGLIQGKKTVLETLAAIDAKDDLTQSLPPSFPLIWLTQNPSTIQSLPLGSRWLLFPFASSFPQSNPSFPGIIINQEENLQIQLQKHLS